VNGFTDRADAGRQLASRLSRFGGADAVVLGLPRGGVPVAFEVARALELALDVTVVRKLGVPFDPELAMGAIGEGGVVVVEDDVLASTRVGGDAFAAVEVRERAALEQRALLLRGERPPASLLGRTAVVVDDGVATGASARAASAVARSRGARDVVLAVPVIASASTSTMRDCFDEVTAVIVAGGDFAVGAWYDDFSPTTDQEVIDLLARACVFTGPRPEGRRATGTAPSGH
jgi:putative phosphoribosyl transferase